MIYATGTVGKGSFAQDGPNVVYATGDIDGAATDETTISPFHVSGPHVPLGTHVKQVNNAIRAAVAAEILSSFGWTIDPDDILLNGQYSND